MTGTEHAAVASQIASDVAKRFGQHLDGPAKSQMAVDVAAIVDMALATFDPIPKPPGDTTQRHYRETMKRYVRAMRVPHDE